MYIDRKDATNFRTRGRADAYTLAANAIGTADAMIYGKDLFKRLTGYRADPAEYGPATEAHRALHYAEDTFARMKGRRAEHLDGRHWRRNAGHARGEGAFAGMEKAARDAEGAIAYARDLFKRLRGLPALGRSVALRPMPSAAAGVIPAATAIRRLMAWTVGSFRSAVLEPYGRRRQRRIAIAELQALDDRLLDDIGVRRVDIERTVDRLLTGHSGAPETPAERPLPQQHQRNELKLAA